MVAVLSRSRYHEATKCILSDHPEKKPSSCLGAKEPKKLTETKTERERLFGFRGGSGLLNEYVFFNTSPISLRQTVVSGLTPLLIIRMQG